MDIVFALFSQCKSSESYSNLEAGKRMRIAPCGLREREKEAGFTADR